MSLPDHLAAQIPAYRECEQPDCYGPHYALGRCLAHYRRLKYWQDPETARAQRRAKYHANPEPERQRTKARKARQRTQREAA
jgi:hypothetical protein